jgi:polysaccharide biosynthesis/export protein
MNLRTSSYILSVVVFAIALPVRAATAPDRSPKSDRSRPEVSRETIATADYILQPLDVLRVHVFQEDSINKQTETISISAEYTVNLPLIKTISLKGKTVRQAEELIRSLYDKDYLVNPQVTVNVIKYAERFVNVTGAVNKADRIAFPQEKGLTIVDAISLAGGPSRIANLKAVKLTRKTNDSETVTIEVNVDAIMKQGARDIPLEKDDGIFVPEKII